MSGAVGGLSECDVIMPEAIDVGQSLRQRKLAEAAPREGERERARSEERREGWRTISAIRGLRANGLLAVDYLFWLT